MWRGYLFCTVGYRSDIAGDLANTRAVFPEPLVYKGRLSKKSNMVVAQPSGLLGELTCLAQEL